ncbi:MAG TPA: cyclase family protein [Nitrospira sp.]|nr:cyclase family protein [Nitrospira sp.]
MRTLRCSMSPLLTHTVMVGVCSLVQLASAGCAETNPGPAPLVLDRVRLVDLTHAFQADTIVWPTEDDFKLTVQHAEEMPGGYYYASNRMELPEHGGTHIDAPVHFSKGKQTLDQVPLDRLIGNAARINVSFQCAKDRDYRITIGDFQQWEAAHGRIPDGTIVLLDTGYGKVWPVRQRYLGTDLRGTEGVAALHFPGLHPEAAAWLVRERKVKAVGIDTASIDHGRSTKFETHVVLLAQNVLVFENLADLSELPDAGFQVIALPMKISGGTGGPLRIIAVLRR